MKKSAKNFKFNPKFPLKTTKSSKNFTRSQQCDISIQIFKVFYFSLFFPSEFFEKPNLIKQIKLMLNNNKEREWGKFEVIYKIQTKYLKSFF